MDGLSFHKHHAFLHHTAYLCVCVGRGLKAQIMLSDRKNETVTLCAPLPPFPIPNWSELQQEILFPKQQILWE